MRRRKYINISNPLINHRKSGSFGQNWHKICFTVLKYLRTRRKSLCLKTLINHCPSRENRFTLSILSISTLEIPTIFLSSLHCFPTNCSKCCCIDTLLLVIRSVSDALRAQSRLVKFVGGEAAGRTPYTFY